MARTSTRDGRRAVDAHRPWPTRREREAGARQPVVPRQRPTPGPAPVVHPGAVPRVRDAPSRERSDAVTDALLASVPPFGTPPFGTRGGTAAQNRAGDRAPTTARPGRRHPRAGTRPAWDRAPTSGHPQQAGPLAPRNGFGVAALCLALVGLPFALVPPTGILAALLGALAVACGLLGWSRARRGVATDRTMSVVATALGLLTLGVGVAGTVILFRATGTVVGDLAELGTTIRP